MANKGLEVIEAMRLFDLDAAQISVIVQPQSLVHALVRLKDGSFYAQISKPDMKLPIQNALYYPQKPETSFGALDLRGLRLDFEPPDPKRFPLLPLAYRACAAGSLYPAAYNAANEEAAAAFLAGSLPFLRIAGVVEETLQSDFSGALSLEAVWEADRRARSIARSR
jgi:1-deoxy-D-xylulose-5-phosphate reductoisomerase